MSKQAYLLKDMLFEVRGCFIASTEWLRSTLDTAPEEPIPPPVIHHSEGVGDTVMGTNRPLKRTYTQLGQL